MAPNTRSVRSNGRSLRDITGTSRINLAQDTGVPFERTREPRKSLKLDSEGEVYHELNSSDEDEADVVSSRLTPNAVQLQCSQTAQKQPQAQQQQTPMTTRSSKRRAVESSTPQHNAVPKTLRTPATSTRAAKQPKQKAPTRPTAKPVSVDDDDDDYEEPTAPRRRKAAQAGSSRSAEPAREDSDYEPDSEEDDGEGEGEALLVGDEEEGEEITEMEQRDAEAVEETEATEPGSVKGKGKRKAKKLTQEDLHYLQLGVEKPVEISEEESNRRRKFFVDAGTLIIRLVMHFVKEMGGPPKGLGAAVTKRVYAHISYYSRFHTDHFINGILEGFPREVTDVIGRAFLTFDDLLQLPKWTDEQMAKCIVYMKAIEYLVTDILGQSRREETKKYIGSGTGKYGGIGRITNYNDARRACENGKLLKPESGAHWKAMIQNRELKIHIRGLSRYAHTDEGKMFCLFSEAIGLVYFRTLLPRNCNAPDKCYASQEVFV